MCTYLGRAKMSNFNININNIHPKHFYSIFCSCIAKYNTACLFKHPNCSNSWKWPSTGKCDWIQGAVGFRIGGRARDEPLCSAFLLSGLLPQKHIYPHQGMMLIKDHNSMFSPNGIVWNCSNGMHVYVPVLAW